MTADEIRLLKGKRKLTMLTAYDFPTAKILSRCGVDILLVGDSLGMVVLGYPDTKSVTMQDMIRHTQAVMRGNVGGSLVVFDMPYRTFDTSLDAVENAKIAVKETGVTAIKIEGKPEIVKALTEAGFHVMGHTGLKPQMVERYKVVGKDERSAEAVFEEAKAIEAAGAFSVVLECVPSDLAQKITQTLRIPTIGIGAGSFCDGQVLVVSDFIGLYNELRPRFVRRYANIEEQIESAVRRYIEDVQEERFPLEEESY